MTATITRLPSGKWLAVLYSITGAPLIGAEYPRKLAAKRVIRAYGYEGGFRKV